MDPIMARTVADRCGDDGRKWAETFIEFNPEYAKDESLLSAWFTHCIEQCKRAAFQRVNSRTDEQET